MKGFETKEVVDQRKQQLDGANANLRSRAGRVTKLSTRSKRATHDVELYNVNIADNTLVAPKDGRIQYRVANIGEVLPAGGKVFTMLDISYVYMDIYLPTAEAGKVKIGADAGSCSMPIRRSRSRRKCHSSPTRRSSRRRPWRPRANATR